uniref:Uncharacterized protein n=1 Tax=Romanomermis culicivorax TaxID=13658 RepID=A0A915IUC5_ROMCU
MFKNASTIIVVKVELEKMVNDIAAKNLTDQLTTPPKKKQTITLCSSKDLTQFVQGSSDDEEACEETNNKYSSNSAPSNRTRRLISSVKILLIALLSLALIILVRRLAKVFERPRSVKIILFFGSVHQSRNNSRENPHSISELLVKTTLE